MRDLDLQQVDSIESLLARQLQPEVKVPDDIAQPGTNPDSNLTLDILDTEEDLESFILDDLLYASNDQLRLNALFQADDTKLDFDSGKTSLTYSRYDLSGM